MKLYKIFGLVIFSIIFAGTDGAIRGKITNEPGDPLPGQVIVLNESGDVVTGTSADFEGGYIILNIQIGMYDVKCTMIGYKTQTIKAKFFKVANCFINGSLAFSEEFCLRGDRNEY